MQTSRLPRGLPRPCRGSLPRTPEASPPPPGPPVRSERTSCPSAGPGKSSFFQLLHNIGDELEQVADQAVVRHLEDRRFLILVDGDDDSAVLHAGQVLDGAGDADR